MKHAKLLILALTYFAAADSAFATKSPQDVLKKIREVQVQMTKIAEVPAIMDGVGPLMDAKKFDEADKKVDEALAKLKEFKSCK